jgi:hypothetical protein
MKKKDISVEYCRIKDSFFADTEYGILVQPKRNNNYHKNVDENGNNVDIDDDDDVRIIIGW